MATQKITQEQYNAMVDERNEYAHRYEVAQQARVKAEVDYSLIAGTDEYKALKVIGQFTETDNEVVTSEVDGVTVYGITVQGKHYDIANAKDAELVRKCISIYKVEKGASIAKYAVLDEVDREKAYISMGCKNIGEYAEKVLGVARGTAVDYLSTLRTFYDCENGYKPLHPLFATASITNLKQAKGYYNEVGKDAFLTKLVNGELHLSGPLSVLKKELSDIDKELPDNSGKPESTSPETLPEGEGTNLGNANHSSEDGKGNEGAPITEVDTPQAQARFYSKKLMDLLLGMANDDTEKERVLTVIDMITGLIK